MTSPIIDAFFIAPRSRRAVHEAVLDWRHERSVATTRAGRLVCRVRAIAAIGRATLFSLPGELRQVPLGDLLLRIIVLLLATALVFLVRGVHPDWIAWMNRAEPHVRLVMFAQAFGLRAALAWPAAFLWRSRSPLAPLPIALLAFVAVCIVDSQLFPLGFTGLKDGPIQIVNTRDQIVNTREWMTQFDVLLTSWTVPVLAASLAFVSCVVVNQVRGWRRLAWLAVLPLSLVAWRWIVELFQQEATRLVYGRPVMGLIFAPERTLLTNIVFAVAALALMWFMVARSKGATSDGMTGDLASAASSEPTAQASSGGFRRSSVVESAR